MPKLTGETLVDGAIRFALATIPQEEQEKLFASLGYDTENEEIDINLCRKAWDECGEEFTKPFFSLAQDQLEDEDKMRAVKKQVLAKINSFSRADGKQTGSTETTNTTTFDNEKWENSKSVIGYIFGLCESGYKTYADAKSQANAAAIEAQQQAEIARLQANAQQNTVKWVLIGGGILVAVVVVIAVVIAMRKK